MENSKLEVNDCISLNKMLTTLLMEVRQGSVDIDKAKILTLVADKINKNNVNDIEYKKISKHKKPLQFFEPKDE